MTESELKKHLDAAEKSPKQIAAAVCGLSQPKPRAMREPVIVPSIGSREVALAQRSGVRQREDALQPLDFGNGLVNVHFSISTKRVKSPCPRQITVG